MGQTKSNETKEKERKEPKLVKNHGVKLKR